MTVAFTDPAVPLWETVPNFAAGRDPDVVAAIANAIAASPGARLPDQHTDPDHHRLVCTAVALAPEAIVDCAFAGVQAAVALCDIHSHSGAHPRIGVADVVPLVPYRGLTLAEVVPWAHRLAQRIGEELEVPVYCYEATALRPERKPLPYVRNKGLGFLAERIGSDPDWAPDYGPARLHPTAGACMVGAREVLIAYNIQLQTDDLTVAQQIARRIRASAPDGLPAVRALGFALPSQGCVQVSVNLLDYRQTTLEKIFEWVERLATLSGVKIKDSEVVGLMPEAAAQGYDLARLRLRKADCLLEERLRAQEER